MISHPVSRHGETRPPWFSWTNFFGTGLFGTGFARAWSYLKTRVRRLRTPKELRDAHFYLWVDNLSKCSNCFFLDSDAKVPTCDICGCNVELKTRWMSEKCPIGEWDNTVHLKDRLANLANSTTAPSPTGNADHDRNDHPGDHPSRQH